MQTKIKISSVFIFLPFPFFGTHLYSRFDDNTATKPDAYMAIQKERNLVLLADENMILYQEAVI